MTDPVAEDFTLVPDRWFAWQMLPGYAGAPYYSPIKVLQIIPQKTGRSIFRLKFYNAFYAEGVRDFDLSIRTLARHGSYLVGEIVGSTDRTCIIHQVSFDWFRMITPRGYERYPPSREEHGIEDGVQAYLERLHPQ